MAIKDLSKVESTNLSDSVNLLAEDGGEIRRVSYAELQAKLDAINESIEEFNILVNNENVKIQTLESQFLFAESVEEMNANVSKLALYRTYPCFLSAECIAQLIPDVSIAAKGYVARPSGTLIDLHLFIGEEDVIYGRYNTSTETFGYNTVCSKADLTEEQEQTNKLLELTNHVCKEVGLDKLVERTNLINVLDSDEGYCYHSSIGRNIELVTNDKYIACKQIFDVKVGEQYTINWLYGAIYLYNADRQLIGYNYVDTIPFTVTVAENGFMTVSGHISTNNNIMLVKGNVLPTSYIGYNEIVIDSTAFSKLIKPLKDVKWCAFGDSLTSPDTLRDLGEKNYVDYVSESTEMVVTNCGLGGTGFIKHTGSGNTFVNRVSTIPTDTEVLTVFGSFNDFEFIETSLGTISDNGTDTIYGAMKSFFNTVFSRCPDIVVGVILPTKWGYLSAQNDAAASVKCDSYVKALIDVAEYFDCPILDLYHHSNLRPWDSAFATKYYKDDDGNGTANTIHPLGEAHKKFIAPKVEAFLKSIYRVI